MIDIFLNEYFSIATFLRFSPKEQPFKSLGQIAPPPEKRSVSRFTPTASTDPRKPRQTLIAHVAVAQENLVLCC